MKQKNRKNSVAKNKQDDAEVHSSDSVDSTVFMPKNRKKMLIGIVGLVIILVVSTGAYGYYRHIKNGRISNGTGASNESQINIVVNKVGKLILLPTGEQPTMAIVNDVSKYSSVPFFKNAANGDRLLIYAQAREAILYRPSINKIIIVAPLNVDTLQSSGSSGQ